MKTVVSNVFLFAVTLLFLAGCGDSKKNGSSARQEKIPQPKKESPDSVRVAAVQFYSVMGDVSGNRNKIEILVNDAVDNGARIVVLPECAVTGYMDPGRQVTWSSNKVAASASKIFAGDHAEPVPGESTKYFGNVARELNIYLSLSLIEKADGSFFNSQVLLGPDGKIKGHHRKKNLWAPGDGTWASEGDKPVQVVDSPYGKLGLMICFDCHLLPEKLAGKGADIVLYSVGWYGPNTENWYRKVFPNKYVVPNGFSVVAANWSANVGAPGWPGQGYSCVIDRSGSVLAMAGTQYGSEIVYADIKIK